MLQGCVLTCLIGLALAMCIPGCAPAPANREQPPPRVTVQHPQQREIVDYNEYNGWTDASKNVELRSRVRGHIQDVAFTDGQIVEKGQLLFQLDPRPFEAELEAAQQQVQVDQANLEFAQAEEERDRELFEKKVVPKAEYQKKIANRKSWEARLAAAKEDVRRKQLDQEYARITAPITGKVSRALLDAGNLVNAGGSDPLLTTIVALDPIFAYFFVDERALLEYRQRNGTTQRRSQKRPLKDSQIPFDFGLETDHGFPNHGILDFADNRIDPKTGTIEVRGTAENSDAQFLPGSRIRVRIPISEPYNAILVPDSAVLSDQDQRYLLCLNDDNVVVRRNVTPGRLLEDGMRVILPGLADSTPLTTDDVVVVIGLQRAQINDPVEALNADGKPFQREGANLTSASR